MEGGGEGGRQGAQRLGSERGWSGGGRAAMTRRHGVGRARGAARDRDSCGVYAVLVGLGARTARGPDACYNQTSTARSIVITEKNGC